MRLLRVVTALGLISVVWANSCPNSRLLEENAANGTDVTASNGTDPLVTRLSRRHQPHWKAGLYYSAGQAISASNLVFNRAAKKITDKIAIVAASAGGTTETFHE